MDSDIIADEPESTHEVANIQHKNNLSDDDSKGPSERHSSHPSLRPLDLSDQSVSVASLPLPDPSTSTEHESSINRIEATNPQPSSTQPSPSPDNPSERESAESRSISTEDVPRPGHPPGILLASKLKN